MSRLPVSLFHGCEWLHLRPVPKRLRPMACFSLFLVLGCAALFSGGCNEPETRPVATDGPLNSPAQVALQDPALANPGSSNGLNTPPVRTNRTDTGEHTTPAGSANQNGSVTPSAGDPAANLNPQAVHKIIEDNITMREEIRRLKIERENLIRLLRAMGENYEPTDEQK